jgi:uncharacterized iron-regulated protein
MHLLRNQNQQNFTSTCNTVSHVQFIPELLRYDQLPIGELELHHQESKEMQQAKLFRRRNKRNEN